MKLIKKINFKKTVLVLLVILMIWSLFQPFGVTAAVNGIIYYEHNFELPLYGATGCPVKDVPGISAGTVFTILGEQGANLKVKLQNGTETTIAKSFCMINLPDVIPSIKYDITNSYSSIFKIRGANITGLTGQSLYQNGTSKKPNPRLGKDEFLVPILYDTAVKIAAAQKKALSEDYTLVIYEAYRPTFAQDKLYAAYSPLVTSVIRGGYPVSWFAASGKSNHQEGYAVDLTLAKVTAVSFITLSNPAYKIANLTVTPCTMITPIHDLTVDAAVYNYQSGMVIYDKTAWKSYTETAAFAGNADCQRLQKYMTDAGLTPFAAEWWHYNDIDARNALGTLTSITGDWELTKNMSILETAAEVLNEASGGTVTLFTEDSQLITKMSYNGSPVGTTDAWYTAENGKNYPAYCLDPTKPGVGESGGSYDVTISETGIDDPKVYGIILAGYPYKNFDELGVSNAWEAAFATKFALKIYLEDKMGHRDVSGWAPINADNQHIYDAIMAIYNEGIQNAEIPVSSVTVTADGGSNMTEQEINGDIYFVKEYTVTSNVQIKSYAVSISGTAPAGAKVTDLNGEEKTTFAAGEKFKVIIPKENVTTSGSITLDVKGEVKNQTILYGIAEDANTQNYALTGMPFIFKDASATADYEADIPDETTTEPPTETTTEETTEPTTPEITTEPTISPPVSGALEIIKLDAGTNTPLPGAVFEIKTSAGNIVYSGSTDDSGKISLSVESGYYSVTEITPPAGYTLDEDPHRDNILIRENETTTVTFTNKKLPSLEIMKVDAVTNAPLAGATIRAAKNGGTKSWDVTTDSQGKATLKNMSPGTYTVTEIVAPSGYVLNETPQIIVLEAGKDNSITIKNWKKPGIVIKKYDEDTGLPLAGAEFSVAKKGGSIIYEGITDGTGIIKVDDLEPGWYSIAEIAAPKNYLISTESKDVYLEPDRVVEVKFDNRLRPSLEITKTDSQTGQPLAGAKFMVKKTEGATESEYITDATGKILINELDEAVYTVWEKEAPNGYVLNTEHKDIQLEWGKVKSLAFTNTVKPSLIIKKYDEGTALPLSGAEFSVAKMSGQIVYEGMVDENGEIQLDNLEPGWYKITEIAAPPGYLMATESKDILLETGKTTEIKFDNRLRPALQIEKRDEQTNAPLAGATFCVKKADSTTVSEYITDSTGTILIHDLDEAVYSVWEVKAPDGYLLDSQHKDITLEWGKVKTLIFTNKARPSLEIKKIDTITGQPLSGAKFKVIKTEDLTVSEYITDETGTVLIKNLDEAIYTVEEITAPTGYILNAQHKEIALEWGKTKTLIYENIRKPDLIITKLNGLTYKPIPNTTYKVEYEAENGGIVNLGTFRTNADGQIILPRVNPGWYIITETAPAQGFSLPSNPVTRKYLAPGENSYTNFEITDTSGDVSGDNIMALSGSDFNATGEEIINYPLNSIVIRKAHAITGELLAGAVFEVRKVSEDISGNSGTVIGRYTTDNSGVIVITGLALGAYIVEEIKAPANFLLSENSQQQAWLKADGTSIVEVTFANIPYGSVLITKVDAQTGKPLANARFKVTDGSGAVAGNTNGEYVTDSNGEILVTNLKPGSYVVTEIEAPANYAVDTTPQTINIGVDGKVYKVSFQNQPAGTLVVRKMDSVSKEPLADAEFKVITAKGDVVGTGNGIFKTDATGTITIPNLPKGAYIIEEIKAPNGYILENQSQTIEVEYGKTYTLDFYNKKMSGVQIIKIDSVTKQPLKGVEFTIYHQSGEVFGRYTTDSNGVIIVDTLSPGWYKCVETKTLVGYLIDDVPKDFQITSNQFVQLIFENAPMSSLIIRKVDADTRLPLKGAEFTVKTMSGSLIGVYTSDEDGTAIITELSPGWYTVTETVAPVGYSLGDNVQTVEITHSKTVTIEFKNLPFGSIVIKKVDEITGKPLTGAVFTVHQQAGAYVGEFTTGNDGTISIPNVAPGWYVVRETKAPQGYILDNTAKTVEVKPIIPIITTFTNKPLTAIQIIKTDSVTHNPLAGARFTVERPNGERIGNYYTTDTSGSIIVSDLEEGVYIVKETIAPKDYMLNETPKTVTVASGKVTIVEFVNDPYGSIVIKKIDEITEQPLSGARFTVKHQSGDIAAENVTTGADGSVTVPNLQPGWYIISETKPPENYHINNTAQTIEVKPLVPTTITFANKPYSGIQIIKTDALTNAPLQDAVFTVQKSSGDKVGDKYTTDVGGKILIPNLPEGVYIITEIQAPLEYVLDALPKTVEVKSGKIAVAEFTNTPFPYLNIIKTDASTGQLLSGAEFVVTNSKGEIIANVISQASGAVSIKVEPGVYTVTEVKAPAGYELHDSVQSVEVLANGKVVYYGTSTNYPNNTASFANRPLNSIEIVKLDAITKNPLSGTVFTIDKLTGERIGSFRTDNSGTVLLTGLAEGAYIIREIIAPNGYILSEIPQTINLSGGRLVPVMFLNKPLSGIQITKFDAVTQKPLQGASFSVTKANGEKIGTFRTESDGKVIIPNLDEGVYVIGELSAPNGYMLDQTPKTVNVVSGKLASVEFANMPYGILVIKKTDEITGRPLSGAHFTVKHQGGLAIGDFITDNDGAIAVPNLEPGWYVVSETKPPVGYHLDSTAKTIEVKSHAPTTISFTNRAYSGIEIIKTDAVTHKPLSGATFTVEHANGEKVGTYQTDSSGKSLVPNLPEGTYIVSETIAPDGYTLDEIPQTVVVKSGKLTTVQFENRPYSGIEIIKVDAINLTPLVGATFVIEKADGEKIGTFRTDITGKIIVPNLPEGTYVVSETVAPFGYVRDEIPKTVVVKSGKLTPVEFQNNPMSGIEIIKINAITKTPLMGATFEITRVNGEKIGTYKTDASGKIIVPFLKEGVYIVSETSAPDGYILSETPKTVEVISGKLTTVEFTNKPFSGIQILKFDTQTKAPLTGATFLLERDNGERIGTYKTDLTGKIIISDLTEGMYVISETAAPQGYILDEAPKTVIVKSGKLTTVEFYNKPLAGLKIIKLDGVTKNPIEGVEFAVTKMNGEKVENDFRGYNFKTDNLGQIYIPNLADGYYTVTETRAVDGYILDGEPKTVLIQSGKTTVLEVLNTPMSGLLIVKTDEITGKPLAGVVYDVKHADGQFVTGSILDENQSNTVNNSPNKTTSPNGDITGSYTTDANGRILINGLDAGEYHVIERKSLDGYELDAKVYSATVTPGKLATLQLTNRPKAGLRIIKIDSISKKPIYNVEFMIFNINSKVVGTYYTDNAGVIDLVGILPEGKYTIRETRPAANYYNDDVPRTVEFKAGEVTEIRWENTPKMGQILLTKKSGNSNTINGLPKGSLLADAVFEVYEYKSGKLVDRFVSGKDGKAVSKPLPLGRYLVKEVQSPKWYILSTQALDIEIEFAEQIIKQDFINYSVNLGVSIKKTGVAECMPGDTIRYDIKTVQNTSNVPLTDFYWRDSLPTNAVRLSKIITGTYNQKLSYKVMITTNKGDNRVIADNLSTTKNNVIDCSASALGLKKDEYVIDFMLVFGTVEGGFSQVIQPQVFVNVLSTLTNGYQFSNKCDAAGKYGDEIIINNSSTTTKIYKKPEPLPRTGY